jgi:DNA mismatch repair protein MutS2
VNTALDPADQAKEDLGLDSLLTALAARARTDLGKARARGRPLLTEREDVEKALRLVEEARLLLGEQRSLPLGGAADIGPDVAQARKGGVLEPKQLQLAAAVLSAAARTMDSLEKLGARVPLMAEIGEGLTDLTSLARRIETSFEPSGEVSDRASSALAAARDRSRGLHRDIKQRIEGLIADREMEDTLQEKYFTLRNERYVVPVKVAERNKLPGIVHNASQTGQTLFVEPQQLVGLGNELAIAQSMAAEEERRVLLELSGLLGERHEEIAFSLDALGKLDEAEAAGRLSNDLLASVPEITRPTAPFNLRSLRHPLLILQNKKVIPSDVRLDGQARALIISGPNAGGKTVTLTAVGLCALMLRMGLPLPVEPGSTMPIYPGVYAAIGDAQDMNRDLSTFSAHLTALNAILNRSSPGALVLIDEMAADTDPREGAALASAILEALLDQGSTALVTTHLEELKALGLANPRYANAHVGFDPDKLAPTYKLHLGMPGASSAIEIARRVGLPEAICRQAKLHLTGATGPLAVALESLESSQRALAHERAEAARLTALAQKREQEAVQKLEQIDRKVREETEVARQKLLKDLESAQVWVSEMVAELQVAPTLARAADAQGQLRQRATEQKVELSKLARPTVEPDRASSISVGGRVRIVTLDREGEVVELKGNDAVIQAGAMRMRLPLSDLVPLKGKSKAPQAQLRDRAAPLKKAEAAGAGQVVAPAETCDVRGLRGDEAMRMVEAFLDRLYGEGRQVALIIHGHGSGALKSSLRGYLDASPYLNGWRPAAANEGGDGATRVELKT